MAPKKTLKEIEKQIQEIINKKNPSEADVVLLEQLFGDQYDILTALKGNVHYVEVDTDWIN